MNSRRILLFSYLLGFLVLAVFTTGFFMRARQEYHQLTVQQASSKRRLADLEAKLRDQEKILNQLRTDPIYLEKVIRQKLGYAKPGEMIFRFEN